MMFSGDLMARINIEDSLISDERFEFVCRKIGKKLAIGEWYCIAKIAQQYWKKEGQLIPKSVWTRQEIDPIFIESGLVKEKRTGFYLSGSEKHFAWIVSRVQNGSKGGRPTTSKILNNNMDLKKPTDNLREPTNNPLTPTLTLTLTKNIYIVEILDYLNSLTGKNFKDNNKKTVSIINARLKENFTIEDFKKVIDIKYSQWGNDQKMSIYLRPETLFGNKFEGYLQEGSCTEVTFEDKIEGLFGCNKQSEEEILEDFIQKSQTLLSMSQERTMTSNTLGQGLSS